MESPMKLRSTALAATLVLASATAASAQQTQAGVRTGTIGAEIEEIVARSGVVPALEALAVAVAPELERTAEQLTGTLAALAARIAQDPQLRASAVRAGQGMVEVAEAVVVERTGILQEALRAAAERLEAMAAAQRERD
jgi:hypothetical protein